MVAGKWSSTTVRGYHASFGVWLVSLVSPYAMENVFFFTFVRKHILKNRVLVKKVQNKLTELTSRSRMFSAQVLHRYCTPAFAATPLMFAAHRMQCRTAPHCELLVTKGIVQATLLL